MTGLEELVTRLHRDLRVVWYRRAALGRQGECQGDQMRLPTAGGTTCRSPSDR